MHVRTEIFGGGQGEGSGVVIDRNGLVVTNNHVVEGTTRVNVALQRRPPPRSRCAGTVVGTAPEQDLAVIRVQADDLVPLAARSLLGAPARRSRHRPRLPARPRRADRHLRDRLRPRPHDRDATAPRLTGLLQTDAAINPGNSGGAARRPLRPPRRDQHRRRAAARRRENVGFAIAIDEALPIIERIRREPADDRRPGSGSTFVSVDSESAAAQLGLDSSVRGAAVTVVYPGGPGEKADLAVGDVITVADDVPINSRAELAKLLAARKPGDELDLELLDSRGPRLVTIRLVRRTPGALP